MMANIADLRGSGLYPPSGRSGVICSIFFLCLFFSARVWPGEDSVVIKRATVSRRNENFYYNAEVDFELSDAALSALNNGVALRWVFRAQVFRERDYLWQKKVQDRKTRFRLRHHALMKMYQLSRDDGTAVKYFATLEAALQDMGTVKNFLLIEAVSMQSKGHYFAVVQVVFERNRLPVPLLYSTYFNPEWFLSSRQYFYAL